MKRNIISFSLFLLLSLAFMSISTMAQAFSTTTVDKFPISGTITACNGENVDYAGTVKIVDHFTLSKSGQVNIKFGATVSVKGVGQLTGTNYVGNESLQTAEHFDANDVAPYNFTGNDNFNLIGQGGVPDVKLKDSFHVTVNANGEITSFRSVFTVDCNP